MQVLELLLKSKPRQNRLSTNPPKSKHVVGSTLGAVGYSGKIFLKKGAPPWERTRDSHECISGQAQETVALLPHITIIPAFKKEDRGTRPATSLFRRMLD